ncbi:MAG: hypothetical protein ABSE59_05865 [Opitutaceae bacterium]|jgi:hypothetical protein
MAHVRDALSLFPADFKPETLRGSPGFFRVGQTRRGQWWLIDPQGRPFFSKGVASVNCFGRADGRFAPVGPYAATVEKLYGANTSETFVRAVLARLEKWQVNTLGLWAAPEFFGHGLACVETLEFCKLGPEIKAFGAKLPDVFDSRWPETCNRVAAGLCAPWRASRELIGYFTDHELGWAPVLGEKLTNTDGTKRARPSLLQICLSLEPSSAAYHAAWEFALAARGGSLATLAREWQVDLPNKETLRQLTQAETALRTPGYLRDQENFSREFAHRYFATCAAAIRRHDPNHLILGCRFGGLPGPAVLAKCVHPSVDVLSAGIFRDTLYERLDDFYLAGGMPVLVGEFAWTGEVFTKRPAPREPRGLTSVERMLRKGRAALQRAFTHPALVGYAWHRWADVVGDAPPFGSGLVHLDDSEACEHTELLGDLNARAEVLRRIAAR